MTENQPDSTQNAGAAIPARTRRIWPAIRAVLRTRIVTGLLIVIPIWVTWVVVKFIFDIMIILTYPLTEKFAKSLLESNKELVPETVYNMVDWIVPVLAVLLTFILLYLLGFMAASVFGRRIIMGIESIFERLPLVKTIYNSTKQIVMTLGGSQQMTFKRVVLVQFPHPGMKCIGFLSSVMKDVDTGRDIASIFISTTPNPTTGYMQIVPLEDVSETNWSVEDAVKLLMSGGIVSPPTVPFDKIHPVKIGPELRTKK